ncbi:HNH endonuclease [Desulfobacter latus]|uniref:HNH endonuclease n=1 Tax=Desulfobacter latus TaxID=2292 RepID=UPI001C499CEB|nr:HNH endonuclease [Desulfobacter latus]
MGYEVREYLLEKWGRTCAYCGKTDTLLEIEYIVPKSKGGSNRVRNLTLACTACNRKKGNKSLEQFLSRKSGLLKIIQKQFGVPLKDAGAVNTTRTDLFRTLKKTLYDQACKNCSALPLQKKMNTTSETPNHSPIAFICRVLSLRFPLKISDTTPWQKVEEDLLTIF